MIPIKTSVEDIQKLAGYLAKQIGWTEVAKVKKTLDSTAVDERKLGAMAEFALLERDGVNIRLTERGRRFAAGNTAQALREVVIETELYRATAEWLMYGQKTEASVTEVGQYWETHHRDTIGERSGSHLKDGAVCFARVFEGADLGKFTVGRGGRESRIAIDTTQLAAALNASSVEESGTGQRSDHTLAEEQIANPTSDNTAAPTSPARPESMSNGHNRADTILSASPNIHVNVEVHIAANATADTVREIFKNMAKYVLDRNVED